MTIHYRYAFAFLFSIPALVFAATPNWQGPYGGIYLGGGFGNNHISSDTGNVTSTSYFTTAADINAVNDSGTGTKNPSTVIAGFQAGHDWVWKQIIYGIAFDFGTLPLSSSSTTNNTYPNSSDEYSVYTAMQTKWLATLRGRLGYQNAPYFPSFIYLTGGMAMTQLRVSNSFSDNSALAGTSSNNTSQNQIGWTIGAGIEVAAYDHVTVDFEYLFVDIPSVKTTGSIANTAGFGIPAQSMTSSFSSVGNFYANLFRVGVNYRFDE